MSDCIFSVINSNLFFLAQICNVFDYIEAIHVFKIYVVIKFFLNYPPKIFICQVAKYVKKILKITIKSITEGFFFESK